MAKTDRGGPKSTRPDDGRGLLDYDLIPGTEACSGIARNINCQGQDDIIAGRSVGRDLEGDLVDADQRRSQPARNHPGTGIVHADDKRTVYERIDIRSRHRVRGY